MNISFGLFHACIIYESFFNFFSTESVRQFLIQENNFYSLLESTKWLKYVSYCLQKSVEATEQLNSGIPVILQGKIYDF